MGTYAHWVRMREFRELAGEVFGNTASTLTAELVIPDLGNRTADEALAAGVEPPVVWHALCDAMDVTDDQRWGRDAKRLAPPKRRRTDG